ncbi:MAG: hypothetical protein QM790_09470 [Nibricoccus sp.]
MKVFDPPALHVARNLALSISLVGFSLSFLSNSASADGRFVVPSSDSGSSPSSPPPPPPSSSSGSDSSSSSSSTYSPPPPDSGGRFTVPTPNYPTSSYSGGGYYRGGEGYSHGGGSPYWGGCYYWGGNYYYWGGYRYHPGFDQFYFDPTFTLYESRFSAATTAPRQTPIFFPAVPPPIGAPLPPKRSPIERTTAPAGLADYIYEPFYAPLSTRLYSKDLSKKLLTRLENFRSKRASLRAELVEKLAAVNNLAPAERIQILETFAREQTPKLIELEAYAEQLRSDLLLGGLAGLFAGTGDWNENRQWRLGSPQMPRARDKVLIYEFLVMRAAVFYQDGLSAAQRRLLREVAMELQVEAFKPTDSATKANQDENLVFFSPETARIRIPDNLPEALAAKIDVYQAEKKRVKAELREKIYQLDASPESKRTQALKQLAEQQASTMTELEALAEDIRAGLVALPSPPGPTTGPAFPPELVARINAYITEKQALQKSMQSRLEELRKELAPESGGLQMKPENGELSYRVQGASRVSSENLGKLRAAVEQLNKENAQRFAQLDREKEAIRSAVATYAAAHPTSEGQPTVKALLSSFLSAYREAESWQPYKDYQTAVYQPGLSPEQRRLLFEVALEKLGLPLPEGEF